MRLIDALRRLWFHNVELARERVEVVRKLCVRVERRENLAIFDILELEENLLSTEKNRHLLLDETEKTLCA